MKKITAVLVFVLALVLSACTKDDFGSKNIQVYTRDTASGTREAFFEILGNKEAIKDNSKVAANMIEVTSNGDMIAKVKADKYAIGYISLSSLEGSKVKGLNVGGFEPTIANVNSGKYTVTRNFNYMMRATFNSVEEQYLTEAFIAYMNSAEGKATIASEGGIVDLATSKELLIKTIKEIDTMNTLINQMLDVSILESHQELKPIPLLIKDEIKAILSSFSGMIEEHAIHIKTELDNSNIQMERKHFHMLVANLIDNAIKYNKWGGTIIITLKDKILQIEDSGLGIKQEDLTHIYERFYRADESNIKQISGSGLGLAIVKHVAQTYKLKITVDSKKGIKTVFTINFN